ncbi:MAG: dynamin family protein, partial [Candidatus Electrothrix sp. MAN1_4]|nr:dynamin family protein [Candidatus Electrothrix sp. MAN1_4]
MPAHALQLDFPALQQQSITQLEQISQFFSDLNTADSRRYQEHIKHQLNLLERLELRMTIVAPMKAGKSTIINALIGQELLPSHSAAMTTLPTE